MTAIDWSTIPAADLTTHKPPALLVQHVLELASDGQSGSTLIQGGAWDGLQLIEACAQSIACLMGAVGRRSAQQGTGDASPAGGMLVGLKGFDITQHAQHPGPDIVVTLSLTHQLGPMQLWTAKAQQGGSTLLQGELKVVRANPEEMAP